MRVVRQFVGLGLSLGGVGEEGEVARSLVWLAPVDSWVGPVMRRLSEQEMYGISLRSCTMTQKESC